MNSMFVRSVHADLTGDHARADHIRAEVEEVARKVDRLGLSAGQLNGFGYLCLFANRFEAADSYFARGIERSPSPLISANLFHSRGEGRLVAGDLDAAESWLRRALEAWVEADNGRSTFAVHDLASVARLRGDLVTAARDYATVLEARRQLSGGNELSQSFVDIASLALAAGDRNIAARLGGVMARRGRMRCHYWLASHARAVWALCRATDPDAFEEARTDLTDDDAIDLALHYCREVAARDG